jgi:eukaryotic-like serine/threonine-protein kinase
MYPRSKTQAERFKRLQAVFEAALEQAPELRAECVAHACGEDAVLAEQVMALLEYEAQNGEKTTQRPFSLATEAFEAAETGALIGQAVGRFRLEAEIASGGMGRVFKARRIEGDVEQIVALKLIRRELFNDALLKRFSDERRILGSLNHPGIVHLIDAGADDHGAPFVAMEYVDGLPLLDYCVQRALSIRERVQLFRQVLAAASYAHRSLVVHRDLKPANVLVTDDGRVKLLDFGIAKALTPEPQTTATVERFLTPAYAAPEQLRGEPATVACDVYALGAILYTLLSGVPPFDLAALSAGEAERQIMKVPPAPMRAAASVQGADTVRARGVANRERWIKDLGGDLESIVQKALRKEPESRYISVDQFDDDIVRYIQRRPVIAAGAGRFYRVRKFCERNAVAVTVAVAVALAGGFAFGHILQQNIRIKQERDRAQTTLEVLKNSFRAANPASPEGRNYSQARVMLAAAAREVGVLEQRRPELFRDMAVEIGGIQINLGLTREGLDLIRRANRSGAEPSAEGLLLEIFGWIKTHDPKRARQLLESQRSKLSGFADFSAREVFLLSEEKRYREAIAAGSRLLADPSAPKNSIEDWQVLRDSVLLTLANSYEATGRLQDAMKVLDEAVSGRGSRYGAEHPLTILARIRRAQVQVQMGQIAAVERELSAMEPAIEKNQDLESDVTLGYHNTYGHVLGELGREEEALEHFLKALRSIEASYGPDSQNAAVAHFNISQAIASSAEDRREAYPHVLRAIEILEKISRKDWRSGLMRLNAARFYVMDGDEISAKRILVPEHAAGYFEGMPDPVLKEYLQALHSRFDWKSCGHGSEPKTAVQAPSVAGMLLCRYDPQAKYRGSKWPSSG